MRTSALLLMAATLGIARPALAIEEIMVPAPEIQLASLSLPSMVGMASWYGDEQGKQTSSGERFDPNEFTAAHRHLPFGTIVRVTNLKNGKSVEVRINDRGPWGDGDRIIDVSSAAADVLQMKKSGLVPVDVEVIRLGSLGSANHG